MITIQGQKKWENTIYYIYITYTSKYYQKQIKMYMTSVTVSNALLYSPVLHTAIQKLGVSMIFFKEIYIFIPQRCIKLIKSDRKKQKIYL